MCPTTGDVSKRPDLREADASTWRRVPAAPSAAMGRVTAKLVAGKATKRAAAQHEAGLLDDDDIARLGWVEWGADAPGAGNALPEALQAPQAHSAQPEEGAKHAACKRRRAPVLACGGGRPDVAAVGRHRGRLPVTRGVFLSAPFLEHPQQSDALTCPRLCCISGA